MRVVRFPMQCVPCETYFFGELLDQAPIEVALAALRAVRCPHCGSTKILLLDGERAAQPEAAMAKEDRHV